MDFRSRHRSHPMKPATKPITQETVIEHYSSLAREDETKHAEHAQKVAESFGYSPDDLAGLPEGANLGVSCGNPLTVAALKPGETVIDLGSGAGFDVFQAARRVGPSGRAIGVDMSPDMLSRASRNVENASIANVSFVLAPITEIPLESGGADCIISNCVINLLSPAQKPVCFKEIYRLLKPGGRVAISDILAKKPFPQRLRGDMALYVGCISGASLVGEYGGWLKEAGFEDVMIVDKMSDLNIYKERNKDVERSSCCGTANTEGVAKVASAASCCSSSDSQKADETEAAKRVENIDFNELVSSYSIYAVKPGKPTD